MNKNPLPNYCHLILGLFVILLIVLLLVLILILFFLFLLVLLLLFLFLKLLFDSLNLGIHLLLLLGCQRSLVDNRTTKALVFEVCRAYVEEVLALY